MIVTELTEALLEMYAKKHLNRELTLDEKRYILGRKGHRIEFIRNRYYRELNELIEVEVEKLGGTK